MTSNLCHLNAFQQDSVPAHRAGEMSDSCVERNQTLFRWIFDIQTAYTSTYR